MTAWHDNAAGWIAELRRNNPGMPRRQRIALIRAQRDGTTAPEFAERDDAPIVRRTVPAGELPAPETTGPRSVFDLAGAAA